MIWATIMSAYCANTTWHFRPIHSTNILPTNEVRKLYKDSDGFIWISTNNGLVRYDGYTYLSFRYRGSEQLLSGMCSALCEDNHQRLWVGTNNGLFVLDKSKGIISKIDFPTLCYSRIEAIVNAPNENLYIATNTGLYVHNTATDSTIHCTGDEWGIPAVDMKTLLLDKQGQLYIGTWSNGLMRYDLNKRRLYRYDKIPALRSSHTLFLDTTNRLWVGTFGNGLILLTTPYDMQGQPYQCFEHIEKDPTSLLDNIVYCIAQEPVSGNIWIGSRAGLSLMVEKKKGTEFINFAPTLENNALPYNEINALLATQDMLYLGSYGGGLFGIDLYNRQVSNDPLYSLRKKYGTASINSIYEDDSQPVFWLALAGYGLIQYNIRTGRYHSYKDIPALAGFKNLRRTTYIGKREQTGELYFATEGGVILYNSQTQVAKPYSKIYNENIKRDMVDDFINYVTTDRHGQLWLATRADAGCLTENGYTPVNSMLADGQTPMPQSNISAIACDRQGNIYITSRTDGVYFATSTPNGRFSLRHHTLPVAGCECVFIDSKDRVWIGTEAGLLLFNETTQAFEPCNYESFRFYSDYVVNAIWEDHKQNIWLATNKGVFAIKPTDNHTTEYMNIFTCEDGLLDDCFHRNCYSPSAKGSIVLGGANGVSRIDAVETHEVYTPAHLALTDFRIYNHSLRELSPADAAKITTEAIDAAHRVTLTHLQNNFTIDFALLNHRNPQNNRYAYMLEGYDHDFNYVDAQHRFAYYNNLPSGTYRFRVRASYAGNSWAEREFPLEICILPAPWRTWWAYSLYTIAAIGLLLLISLMSVHRIRIKQEVQKKDLEKRQAEELTQAKLQFFTNITHELLTPLSIIIAAVDELKQQKSTDSVKAQEYDLISVNATRLMRLIQQILEFRKAESGNLRLKVAEGNISQFVIQCVSAFAPLAHKQGLTFSCNQPKQPIIGYFDSDKLDKILYNLLSNASKYNRPNGTVCVTLSTRNSNNTLELKIMDTGCGMTEEAKKNMFKRFYDGEYRQHHTIGSGIGLALVKNLVDLHHGQIFVDSIPEKGSTFTILLPICREEYLESETGNHKPLIIHPEAVNTPTFTISTMSDEPQEEITPQKTHILFVDDNEDLVYIIRQHLAHTYRVATASSAEEALKILQTDRTISLIISDIVMDGMNGYDFCAILKQTLEYSHLPVILLTAKQTAEDQVVGYKMGADAYLTKPFDIQVLDAMIANLLQKQQKQTIDYRHQLVFDVKEMNYTSIDQQFLQQAIDCVHSHINDTEFGLSEFCNEMNISRSTLAEKLKTLTGLTPSGFINDIRLRTAYIMLEKDRTIRISELAYSVGFNDPKYFSTLFRKKFSFSPNQFPKDGQTIERVGD